MRFSRILSGSRVRSTTLALVASAAFGALLAGCGPVPGPGPGGTPTPGPTPSTPAPTLTSAPTPSPTNPPPTPIPSVSPTTTTTSSPTAVPGTRADVAGMVYGGHFPLGATHQLKFEIGPAAPPLTWTEPRPTGTVVLFDRGVRLGEVPLRATDMVPVSRAIWEGQLVPGYAIFTATYGGDANYKPSEFSYSPGWVQNAVVEFTYPETVTSGETYTLSAKVTGIPDVAGTPTGHVAFSLGTGAQGPVPFQRVEVPLGDDGFATVDWVAPAVGTPTEVRVYGGYSGDSVFVNWGESGFVTFVPAA